MARPGLAVLDATGQRSRMATSSSSKVFERRFPAPRPPPPRGVDGVGSFVPLASSTFDEDAEGIGVLPRARLLRRPRISPRRLDCRPRQATVRLFGTLRRLAEHCEQHGHPEDTAQFFGPRMTVGDGRSATASGTSAGAARNRELLVTFLAAPRLSGRAVHAQDGHQRSNAALGWRFRRRAREGPRPDIAADARRRSA